MILNSYALLVAFVGMLRLLLGVLVLVLGVTSWRATRRVDSPEARDGLEDRIHLLLLLALILLVLNAVSWPLLYLLLQSYVPEWPGVMCIYGVTQIGTGSLGPARHLPDLLILTQAAKPALFLVGGAWFALYLLNRRTGTAPLLNRLFVLLLPIGALATVDAAAELAYVAIPKQEEFPNSGCCTVSLSESDGRLRTGYLDDEGRRWLTAAFGGINTALVLALLAATRRPCSSSAGIVLAALVGTGVVGLAATALFLIEVAAPALLGLPHHHCLYDLIPHVPEAVVAIALYLASFFCLVWSGVLHWFGRRRETESILPDWVRGLLGIALLGYLASLAMLLLELSLS